MKNIVLIINEPPNGRTSEKLRMGVGLTLDDSNKVSVLLIDEGVFTTLGMEKDSAAPGYEIDKHLETLGMLKVDLLAFESSVKSRDLALNRFGIRTAGDEEVARLLENSDITIT